MRLQIYQCVQLTSVVFSIRLKLLVVNTSSFVDSHEQQTMPLTSNECHQLASRHGPVQLCVYHLLLAALTTRDNTLTTSALNNLGSYLRRICLAKDYGA